MVRFDEIGSQCSEGIIVPKADFIGHHGIILIHHRNHTQLQQAGDGAAGIQIALAMGQIIVG